MWALDGAEGEQFLWLYHGYGRVGSGRDSGVESAVSDVEYQGKNGRPSCSQEENKDVKSWSGSNESNGWEMEGKEAVQAGELATQRKDLSRSKQLPRPV